jgi:hypothetical protein
MRNYSLGSDRGAAPKPSGLTGRWAILAITPTRSEPIDSQAMTILPDPDRTLDAFVSELSRSAQEVGWTLVRFSRGHSDRDFELRCDTRRVSFTTKISQTGKGFWGLTEAKAQQLSQTKEQLILLNSEESGYFISSVAYERLLPKFSRTKENAVRINEGIVRKEMRFAGADEAFEMLKARAVALT